MKRGIVGIYVIENNENGKIYIGQSVDVEYRICNHFSCLKHNRHDNEHMQRAYNKNPEVFSWRLLEECEIEQLDDREVWYIEHYESTKPENGYNRSYGGQTSHRATEETKRKMSETKTGKKFTAEHCRKIGEANRKRKLSDETKAKISEKHNKPIVQYSIDGEFIERYDSKLTAAKKLGISPSNITNVLRGRAKTSAGYVWKYE